MSVMIVCATAGSVIPFWTAYATTLAAYAYAWTATSLANYALCCVTWIPYLGQCVSLSILLWGLAWVTLAMVRAHRTDTWRAIVAVWGPVLVCGGCCAGLQMLGLLAARAGGGL